MEPTAEPTTAATATTRADGRNPTATPTQEPVETPSAENLATQQLLEQGPFAFVSTRDGNPEIYLAEPDGSDPRRLTNDPAADGQPAWSPDASLIAFASDRAGGGAIFVMAPDGSAVRQVSTGGGDSDPAWSPDGTQLVFSRATATGRELVVLTLADGSERILGVTTPFGGQGHALRPAWSPDGASIAYQIDGSGDYDIWMIAPDGQGAHKILGVPGAGDFHPAWGPDGSGLLYTSDRDGTPDLWFGSPDGSQEARLTFNTDDRDERDGDFSTGGAHVVYVLDAGAGSQLATAQHRHRRGRRGPGRPGRHRPQLAAPAPVDRRGFRPPRAAPGRARVACRPGPASRSAGPGSARRGRRREVAAGSVRAPAARSSPANSAGRDLDRPGQRQPQDHVVAVAGDALLVGRDQHRRDVVGPQRPDRRRRRGRREQSGPAVEPCRAAPVGRPAPQDHGLQRRGAGQLLGLGQRRQPGVPAGVGGAGVRQQRQPPRPHRDRTADHGRRGVQQRAGRLQRRRREVQHGVHLRQRRLDVTFVVQGALGHLATQPAQQLGVGTGRPLQVAEDPHLAVAGPQPARGQQPDGVLDAGDQDGHVSRRRPALRCRTTARSGAARSTAGSSAAWPP